MVRGLEGGSDMALVVNPQPFSRDVDRLFDAFISGERKAEHESRERGWYRIERSFGSFSRSLTLPDGVDADAISAQFDRGVLEVRIPKPEERKPRRVQIGTGSASNGGAPAVEGSAA